MLTISPGPWSIRKGSTYGKWHIYDANNREIATLEKEGDAHGLVLLLKLLNDFMEGADRFEHNIGT